MRDNASQKQDHVRVWDLPIRAFHWSIVILLFISWFSADQGSMRVHLWSGLTMLALLLFRLAWGIFGSTTARFSDFLHPPRKVIGYLRALTGEGGPRHAGHNPAGGMMVGIMIAVLLAQVLTGLFANDGLHFNGPLAVKVSADASDRLTRLHGTVFNLILLLVWAHLVAIGFYLFVKGENLVRPMLTGRKSRDHVPPGLDIAFTRTYVAVGLLLLTAGIVAWITS